MSKKQESGDAEAKSQILNMVFGSQQAQRLRTMWQAQKCADLMDALIREHAGVESQEFYVSARELSIILKDEVKRAVSEVMENSLYDPAKPEASLSGHATVNVQPKDPDEIWDQIDELYERVIRRERALQEMLDHANKRKK